MTRVRAVVGGKAERLAFCPGIVHLPVAYVQVVPADEDDIGHVLRDQRVAGRGNQISRLMISMEYLFEIWRMNEAKSIGDCSSATSEIVRIPI